MRKLFSNVRRAARVRVATPPILLIVVAALLVTGPVTTASGSGITLATPSGLNPGDSFRFAFVTDDYVQATETDIGWYNAAVNAYAYGATYNGALVDWKAIGSSQTVAARDNVGGFGLSIPVYLVDGTRVANDLTTNTGGFWSGSLLPGTYLDMTIFGTNINQYVWTGSNNDGTIFDGYYLGEGYSRTGYTGYNTGFISDYDGPGYSYYYLFGMSSTLTVPAAVPEIDPAGMGSVLALVTGAIGLLERRRKRQ